MQKTYSEQYSMTTSKIKTIERSSNGDPSKNNVDDIFSERKIEQPSSFISFESNFLNGANALFNQNELNKHNRNRLNFVRMCRQKLDRNELPTDFDEWMLEQQYDHLINNVDKYFTNIPASLRFMLPALFKDGDCGRSTNEKPDWLDIDKFRRGQKFCQKYLISVCIAQLMSLIQLFTFVDDLKILILSRKSNTPYRAYKRYLSTLNRLYHWSVEDPWDQSTQAYRDIQDVRKMHLTTRRRLCNYDKEQIAARSQISQIYCPMWETFVDDFRDTCPAAKDFQCPLTMFQTEDINQCSMSGTQFGFVSMILLYPKQVGIHHVSDEDLDAYCHLWRGIGYLLGIEDRYNFCRDGLQETRTRCKDMLEQWVKPNLRSVNPEWEHMLMCVHRGTKYYLPTLDYKLSLLYFCNTVGINMPRLYKSLNFIEKTVFMFWNFFINYLLRLPILSAILNTLLNKRINSTINRDLKKQPEKNGKKTV